MIWIFYLFLGITILTVVFGFILSGPGYDGPKSEHFDGKRFVNPNGLQAQNLIGVMKYGLFRNPEKWVKNYETDVRSESIPLVQESQVQISFVNINLNRFLIAYFWSYGVVYELLFLVFDEHAL